MKRKFLRAVSLLLVLLSLVTCLLACKKDSGEAEETESGEAATAEPGETWETDENGFVKDTINRTLGGKTMKLLMDTSSVNDIMPQDVTSGNVIMHKAYTRNLNLEMRLDCKFEVMTAPGEYANMTEYITVAEKAGDSNIDIICAFSLVPSQLQRRGLLSNLKNLEYPQLEMPWWPESVQGWEHNGAIYYVANNSSNRVIRAQEVVFANTEMIKNDTSLTPLEQLVIDGDWTLDTMIDYALTVSTNTEAEFDDRVYGLAVDQQGRMDQFYYGSGLNLTEADADGNIHLTSFAQNAKDKTVSLITKLGKIANTPGFFIGVDDKAIIRSGRAMFVAGYMNMIFELDDSSTYIPLPTPKYDLDQENYYTTPHNSYDVWCIPMTCADKEDSALVIEAIASTDYREMAPFFYEDKLKMRYSDSAEGMQIFDLIRTSTNIDFGRITAATTDIMETPFRLCFFRNGSAFYENKYLTELEKNETAYNTRISMILTTFQRYREQ